MATIRFDYNVPVDLTLKFDHGREVEGQYGPQLMFTVVNDDKFYLDVHCDAIVQMQKLQIRRNIPFRITKCGRPKEVSWTVQRLDSIEQQLKESVALAKNGQRPGSSPSATTANVVSMPASTANNNPQSKSTGMTLMSQALAGCLIAAIDAINVAEQYAAAKGITYEFGSEDARALASTIFIQTAKGLPMPSNDSLGGASKWQQ